MGHFLVRFCILGIEERSNLTAISRVYILLPVESKRSLDLFKREVRVLHDLDIHQIDEVVLRIPAVPIVFTER